MKKMLRIVVSVVTILVMVMAYGTVLPKPSSALASSGWSIETVDSIGNVGIFPSLAFDSSGNPAISYVDWTNHDLKLASGNVTAWSIQTVDSYGFVGFDETSLAFDSSGNPAISYSEGGTIDNTKFARWTGATWSLEVLDNYPGHFSSLAFDLSGNPAIAYSCYNPPSSPYNYVLKFAHWTGTDWSYEIVDDAFDVGAYASLAFDQSSGNPAISYWDRTNRDLKFARWDGSQWVKEIVDSTGEVGEFASLALDLSGNPAISYYDRSNGDLKLARWTGSAWSIESVDNLGDAQFYNSLGLAFDSSWNPAISYFDNSDYHLKLARWDGSQWVKEIVDDTGNVGHCLSSLAFDHSGNPAISYYDSGNGDLKFARAKRNTAPIVNSLTADPSVLAAGGSVYFTATFTDPDLDDTHTAVFTFGDSQKAEGAISDRTVTGAHSYATVGVYTVTLTINDSMGGVATASLLVAVYDSSAGFVTGGGWIDSLPGAYTTTPLLAGKADFGFVSKYQKGAEVPTGQTEFQFRVADLNFHSTIYQWLVVAGARAQFKGDGTINGIGDYRFFLTAIDGDIQGGGDSDKFRIRIWDKATDAVIYDNQLGADDGADPTTVIGGGSIVIHAR
jgi:hypothetical protein